MRRYESQKGGECANTEGCKVHASDKHNNREIENNKNKTIRPELTHLNSVWMDPTLPSLSAYDKAIRKDYYSVEQVDKLGRKYHRSLPTKGKTAASPLKETILLLPTNGPETDAMVNAFVEKVEQLTGWKAVRKFVHRDERFDDPDTGKSTFNKHAHIVWDCYDWKKHEVKKAFRGAMRKMQDYAAEVTGMPRGVPAELTNAKHQTVLEYKNSQERQRAAALEKKIKELNTKENIDYQAQAIWRQKMLKKLIGEIIDTSRSDEEAKETIIGHLGPKFGESWFNVVLQEKKEKLRKEAEKEELQRKAQEIARKRAENDRISTEKQKNEESTVKTPSVPKKAVSRKNKTTTPKL